MAQNPKAYTAGELMGKAIVEMVHLMYQNNTAAHFLRGLAREIDTELFLRGVSTYDREYH